MPVAAQIVHLSLIIKTEHLSSNIVPRENHVLIDGANYIALTNQRCDEINKQWFDMASGEKFVIPAIDTALRTNKHSEDYILNHIVPSLKHSDVSNFLPVLNLAIGHEYDFVKNLDMGDGITNGTPCTVKYYQAEQGVIWVDTKDKKVGAQ